MTYISTEATDKDYDYILLEDHIEFHSFMPLCALLIENQIAVTINNRIKY